MSENPLDVNEINEVIARASSQKSGVESEFVRGWLPHPYASGSGTNKSRNRHDKTASYEDDTGDLQTEVSYDTVVPQPNYEYTGTMASTSESAYQATDATSSTYNTTPSTAPSLQSHHPTFVQQFHNMTLNGNNDDDVDGALDDDRVLVCEFRDILGCDRTFLANQKDAWIRHVSRSHLDNNFPPKSVCWFCDEQEYEPKHRSDRRRYFEERMKHVRRHIVREGLRYVDMRPDFDLLKYMLKHGLIDKATWDSKLANFTELPAQYRLADRRPWNWEPPEMVAKRYHESRMPHNLEKEDRMRKKSKK